MRRIHLGCLCALAGAALKPPRRRVAAVRPRARAIGGIVPIFGMPRGGGRSTSRARAGVAKPSMLWVKVRVFAEAIIHFTLLLSGNIVALRLLVLRGIMTLDVVQTKWLRGLFLAADLAVYTWTFCKAWHPRLARDIFVPKSGFLTWSVLAYWGYALKQIYLAGGRAAVLSKEALGPAACAIAGYFLLANLPELSGV